MLHTQFFGVEMYRVVTKRLHALNNEDDAYPFTEFMTTYTDFGLLNVLFFVVNKRIQLFKFNQTVFSIMFVLGFARIGDPDVDTWYMVSELTLGFIMFGALMGVMLGVCLAMPIMFFLMYLNRNHQD